MTKISYSEFKTGRRFIGRLPHGKDLIQSIENFCQEVSIQMATFSALGTVTSAILGTYDQKQMVYVTFKENAPLEIVACRGNVSIRNGRPFVHAGIVLCDEQGKIIAGRLFSETLVFAGEFDLHELIGEPLERTYNHATGLMQWNQLA
jgi:predicted DNA-binding protein with PD1-like motif